MMAASRSWLLVQECETKLSRSKIKPSSWTKHCFTHFIQHLLMSPIRDLNLYILVKENIWNPLSHEGMPFSLRISPIGHKDIISSSKRMKNEFMTEIFQVQHMLNVWDLISYILVKAFFQPFKWKKFHQQHFSEKLPGHGAVLHVIVSW